MFRSAVELLRERWTAVAEPEQPVQVSGAARDRVTAQLSALNSDVYLAVMQAPLNLVSVFDDLKYDRSDLDAVSAPMRRRVVSKLAPMGFRQISGGVLENAEADMRMYFPKFRALGAGPFDTTRDTPRRKQDFYVLTPTQTACQLIQHHSTDDAVAAIEVLIARQPVNLLRIMDFLEKSDAHKAFAGAIGHLEAVQREAVASEPLRSRRALR